MSKLRGAIEELKQRTSRLEKLERRLAGLKEGTKELEDETGENPDSHQQFMSGILPGVSDPDAWTAAFTRSSFYSLRNVERDLEKQLVALNKRWPELEERN